MSDDPLDPLLHVEGLAAGLDVVVAQPDSQVLYVVTTQTKHEQLDWNCFKNLLCVYLERISLYLLAVAPL